MAGAAALAQACDLGRAGAAPPEPHDLDAVAAAIIDGGERPDGIPAIDYADYDPVGVTSVPRTSLSQHVGEYDDEDVVDALLGPDGVPRAYPRWITVWHEIVNDVFADQPVAITYCPLTSSSLVFSGRLARATDTTFGVSGRILNSNLVLLDRATRSSWPQLLGVAVDGPRKGERLRPIPTLVTTTLGRWRARFPRSLVLTPLTGWLRPYGTWPYGRDYDRDDRILFPLTTRDARFLPKQLVLGVARATDGGRIAAAAIDKAAALSRSVTTLELDGMPFVALGDADLAVVRVFRSEAGGRRLTLRADGRAIVDRETGSHWSYMGIAVDGALATERLEQVAAPEVFWFAWYAAYPRTAVIA